MGAAESTGQAAPSGEDSGEAKVSNVMIIEWDLNRTNLVRYLTRWTVALNHDVLWILSLLLLFYYFQYQFWCVLNIPLISENQVRQYEARYSSYCTSDPHSRHYIWIEDSEGEVSCYVIRNIIIYLPFLLSYIIAVDWSHLNPPDILHPENVDIDSVWFRKKKMTMRSTLPYPLTLWLSYLLQLPSHLCSFPLIPVWRCQRLVTMK